MFGAQTSLIAIPQIDLAQGSIEKANMTKPTFRNRKHGKHRSSQTSYWWLVVSACLCLMALPLFTTAQPAPPADNSPIIGIDLGTTYS